MEHYSFSLIGGIFLGMVRLVAVPMVLMNWVLARREASQRARGFGLPVPTPVRRVMPVHPCYRVVGRMRVDGRSTTFYITALTPDQARDRAEQKGVAVTSIEEEW